MENLKNVCDEKLDFSFSPKMKRTQIFITRDKNKTWRRCSASVNLTPTLKDNIICWLSCVTYQMIKNPNLYTKDKNSKYYQQCLCVWCLQHWREGPPEFLLSCSRICNGENVMDKKRDWKQGASFSFSIKVWLMRSM